MTSGGGPSERSPDPRLRDRLHERLRTRDRCRRPRPGDPDQRAGLCRVVPPATRADRSVCSRRQRLFVPCPRRALAIGPEAELRFGRRHFSDMPAVFTAAPQLPLAGGVGGSRTSTGRNGGGASSSRRRAAGRRGGTRVRLWGACRDPVEWWDGSLPDGRGSAVLAEPSRFRIE
jgi:hypothetical protein